MTLCLTGATGFLGSYLAARLLATTDERIVALVRGEDDAAAQARLDAALTPLLGDWDRTRARALAADLTGELPPLPDDVTRIVHCAADVAFDRPLDAARAINVEGTRRVLAAARALPALERFVHVSTAFVCGSHPGLYTESDLDLGQGHRNTYERTKLEAELLVHASGLPTRIVRPSIVVGDSATGWTSTFNVLYFPLQAYERGLVSELPGDPTSIVDVVPVDHVTDVIVAALDPATGDGTLHAVAAELAPSAGELAALASRTLGRPPLRLVTAESLGDAAGPVLDALDVYFPYFSVAGRLGAARTRALGLQPPPVEDYFERLVAYARLTRWGRRPVAA